MTHEVDTYRSIFIAGLRDVHAVEHQALALIDRQLGRVVNYPELIDRLHAHRAETETQIKRLEQILEGLNERYSGLKDLALQTTGNLAALAHTLAGDEILKNTFASFAFENFEAASYLSLVTIAELCTLKSPSALLRESLEEERSMALWLQDHVPELTSTFLQRSASDLMAAR